MEIADVRKQVRDVIERARRHAAGRRAANDEASRAFDEFLELRAVPLFRQIANVLKVEGYHFTVFTPSRSVRLMSDRSADDYLEIALDTSGGAPHVMLHVSRSRGNRVLDEEKQIPGNPSTITEQELLAVVLKELEAFVER
jgi:hypothetical protein